MDENDTDHSESNSQITVVSNDTFDSNTSRPEQKFEETDKRIKHCLDESKQTRNDFKRLCNSYDSMQEQTAAKYLRPEEKIEFDSIVAAQREEIKTQRNAIGRSASLQARINTNQQANKVSIYEAESFKLRKNFLDEKIGNTLTYQDKNMLNETSIAQNGLAKDLLTLNNNVNKLSDKKQMLASAMNKLEREKLENLTTVGESSGGVKRNREISPEQEVNTTKQQKTRAESSLLDDYADLSTEYADYFSSDD